MQIFKLVMEYLRERQTPLVRYLHITILILVLSQIIVSNFIEFEDSGAISTHSLSFFGTWLHIITGLFIFPLALIFLVVELKLHGIKYFFPYLYGDVSQIKNDIQQLKKLQLPEPNAYGMAAAVQGLGLGALLLVLLSGLSWFLSWYMDLSWSDNVKEAHEFLTGLIVAYVVGHGAMGIMHIFLHSKLQKSR